MSPVVTSLLAAVEHRLTCRLLDGFDAWWQPPAAFLAVLAVVVLVIATYRRDAADLAAGMRVFLAALRLAAVGAVLVACLDVERIAEHEFVMPSRVAVLVDSSASMALPDTGDAEGVTRGLQAVETLDGGGLLAALAQRHEVAVWRFDADAEPLAVLPIAGRADGSAAERIADRPATPAADEAGDWRRAVAPRGHETRLGEALAAVLERERTGCLAGVILLSDGGNNAGIEPLAAAGRLAASGVRVEAIGFGSETLPANVRVADLIVPARVFPGDAFAVTAYLQAQGLEGDSAGVELVELPATAADATQAAASRVLDSMEAVLGPDGELVAVRFDVAGLPTAGSRLLAVRLRPPPSDRTPADDVQAAGIEVVDRVTRVLLMAGGPGREYQFMRNVLHRDASFEVDVLLGTAAAGISQDARRILQAFPPNDEALAVYDAVVAIDYDWRLLEPVGWARLERWVAREAGGLLVVAGGIHMDAWLGDPRAAPLRGLFPVELRRPGQLPAGGGGHEEPMPLEFTADGGDAEYLWLAAGAESSRRVWSEFPGVYSCFPVNEAKPGATVLARVVRPGDGPGQPRPIFLANQPYAAGSVLYVGSGELWRLRTISDACYERLAAQLVRHVSQGRIMQGNRRARLLVDRERHPVGGTIQVRLALADDALLQKAVLRPPTCRATGPDGSVVPIPLLPDPTRPGALQGSFVAAREGIWRVDLEAVAGLIDEPLTRRIQVQLPDRELARPKLDRPLLEQIAGRTGGRGHFPAPGGWSVADAAELATAFPDRSRREYETGAADADFKRRLNTALLAAVCGCLFVEWIVRRFARLA